MGFIKFRFIDLIDIGVIAFVIYYFLKFIRGTRALQMLIGLIIIFVIGFIAGFLNLQGFSWIISALKTAWVVAFVILFQPEIRNALASLGKTRVVRLFIREEENKVVKEVCEGAIGLSERGIGGLIAIERKIGLKSYVDTGVSLDARVKSELISTIFTPYSPLHDGAIIIKGDTIVAAGCILPLSESPFLNHSVGTRHRAALGLSEQTDAVCIVISEETRKISLAVEGRVMWALSEKELRDELTKAL